VVLVAWCLPRRRDSVETVGAALVMAANGSGHRTIAAKLERPESTVRNWLRRARAGAERLRRAGVVAAHELDCR
jgi:transposase